MIVSAAAIIAGSLMVIVMYQGAVLQPAPADTGDFPHCLRTLQCASVSEFDGVPFEQLIIIAKNYDRCFEDFKIEQTCNVQVMQDIERFHELGYVTLR